MPGILEANIKGYRYKETRPLNLDVAHIMGMANAASVALKFGMPEIGAKNLTNKILLEGREDAGTNGYNTNNPAARKLFDSLKEAGVDDYFARYPAAVLDKSQVAKRLGIPFELAWNGTGKTAEADGARHAVRAAAMANADKDPRNAGLVDLVQRTMRGDNTPQENLLKMSDNEVEKALFGSPDSGTQTEIAERAWQTMKDLKFSSRQKEGTYDLFRGAGVPSALTRLYKDAAGIKSYYKAGSRSVDQYQDIKNSPDAMAVVNTMIGVDPGGAQYLKDHPEPPGIIDRLMSIFK